MSFCYCDGRISEMKGKGAAFSCRVYVLECASVPASARICDMAGVVISELHDKHLEIEGRMHSYLLSRIRKNKENQSKEKARESWRKKREREVQ